MLDAKAQINEELLLAERAVRDSSDFLALYDRYFPRVYTYFRYRFNNPAQCDDLCAQTFLQAMENIHQFSPARGPFIGWLFGIARNLANQHLQRSRRFQLLSLDTVRFLACNESSPEERTIELDEQRRMLQAMAVLSPQQRDVLGLKFSAGLNNRQIAALTGLSEQNVGVILFRAIRKLRHILGGTEDSDA